MSYERPSTSGRPRLSPAKSIPPSTAPMAPSAEQLRSRLLSPRQKGTLLRPSTSGDQRRAETAPIFTDTIADSSSSADWNFMGVQTDKLSTVDFNPSSSNQMEISQNFASLSSRLYAQHHSTYPGPGGTTAPLAKSFQSPGMTLPSSPMGATKTRPKLMDPNYRGIIEHVSTFEEAVKYFKSRKLDDGDIDSPIFFHVTPRYNVENVRKENFYDLVILEHPGFPSSGVVWDRNSTRRSEKMLDKYQLMQLSAKGLLFVESESKYGGSNRSYFISLDDFLFEKSLCSQIQSKTVFKMYRESKVFRRWKLMVRAVKVRRSRERLLEKTFFSHRPFLEAMQSIQSVVYTIEHETELFAFQGTGGLNVQEFIHLQITKLEKVKVQLRDDVSSIGDLVSRKFSEIVGDENHLKNVGDIKDNHPFAQAAAAGVEVDWVALRAIQRLYDDCRLKFENILCVAEFKVQAAVAHILEKFWLRFRRLIKGVRHVPKRRITKHEAGYWDLEAVTQEAALSAEGADTDGDKTADDKADVSRSRRGVKDASIPDNSYIVTRDWLLEGAHLSVNVSLCLRSTTDVTADDLLMPENVRNLRIKILPVKKVLVELIHILYGAMGSVLEALPNLRKHPLVHPTRFHEITPRQIMEVEDDAGDRNSKGYFTKLHLFPILNSAGGLMHATDVLRLITSAHNEACEVEMRVAKLEDALLKLSSLNPDGLVKQMNYSVIVPKMLKIIMEPDKADDIERALMRERGRLVSLDKVIDYLDSAKNLQSYFLDIKHEIGLVTSFQSALAQLARFREIQTIRLYGKLPNTFMQRCKAATDCFAMLDSYMELGDAGLGGLLVLLKKLKRFEAAQEMFLLEMQVIDTLHKLLTVDPDDHDVSSTEDASELAVSVSIRAAKHQALTAFSPDILYRHFNEKKIMLYATVTRGKSLLLGLLVQIKKESLENRRLLHERIQRVTDLVLSPPFADKRGQPVHILHELQDIRSQVEVLRKSVNDLVNTQEVLTEAHDIIGAANIVLTVSEIDYFEDMPILETVLDHRLKVWNSVVETQRLIHSILSSRFMQCDVKKLNAYSDQIKSVLEFLDHSSEDSGDLPELLMSLFRRLEPMIEVITFILFRHMKPRHWHWLGDNVFCHCDYKLKFSGKQYDVVTVMDMAGREPVSIGSISGLVVSDLVHRGIEAQIGKIRMITAEAAVESMIEITLNEVETTIKSATIAISTHWLRDSRLREKIFFELYQATNLTQMSVLLHYCQKSALILEQISLDMNLNTFHTRLESMKEVLLRLHRFVENIRDIQYKWMYCFHFVKFAAPGELERESTKTFQHCTDELKRMELALQQKSGNLLTSCAYVAEYEHSTETAKHNLTSMLEDAHSNIQSLLDACPRLSLLSYNRLNHLYKAWLLGPHMQLELVGDSLHDMFEGVGKLQVNIDLAQRLFLCTGFVSSDSFESILFHEKISFAIPLPDFVHEFETQLRLSISRVCDILVLHRVQSFKLLFVESDSVIILDGIEKVFSQRMSQLCLGAIDEYPNQCLVLNNYCYFAEDVWMSLGHPTGCATMAKPDFTSNVAFDSFSNRWKDSLLILVSTCKANISQLLKQLQTGRGEIVMKEKKAKALCTSLFLQEVYFLRCIEELLACKCFESANEMWAGRYQLKFLFDKELRFRDSPFDVLLGCITVPYGLEYQGGKVPVVMNNNLEDATQKILSSAMCLHATVLVSHDADHALTETVGEYSVSCKDIATALGRICITLLSVQHAISVRLFLARLAYLDAVGCIDFTTIDHPSLQILMSVLDSFWRAIETKNDIFVQDSLKYPLKTKFCSTEIQLLRRKENLLAFRQGINALSKANKYSGLIVVAVASETRYSDITVFDYFSKSVFNTIAVQHNRPIDELGLLLSVEGFVFGLEIQSIMEKAILTLKSKYKDKSNMMGYLSSSRLVIGIAREAGKALSMRPAESTEMVEIHRLKIELECFSAVLWENILLLGDDQGSDLEHLRDDTLEPFQTSFEELTKENPEGFQLSKKIVNSKLELPPHIEEIIQTTSQSKGVWTSESYSAQCACLWNLITNPSHSLVILSGAASCGKTTLRDVAVEVIRKIGVYPDLIHSRFGPLKCWRAGFIIAKVVKKWFYSPRAVLKREMRNEPAAAVQTADVDDEESDEETTTSHSVQAKKPLPESVVSRLAMAAMRGSEKDNVKVSVIFHASLSSTCLLGGFDSLGRWSDGILPRKIRSADETQSDFNSEDKKPAAIHLIVLDGPLGYYVEQIFGSSHCLSSKLGSGGKNVSNGVVVFPSGEIYNVPNHIRILLETGDLSHASPALLIYSPHLHCKVEETVCCERLLKVWTRSVANWLGNFSPWRDSLEDILTLLVRTSFVSQLLFLDAATDKTCTRPSVIVSKIGTFLRILEELLQKCHSLAIADATFIDPDFDGEKETKYGSDDSDEDSNAAEAAVVHVSKFASKIMVLAEKDKEKLRHRVRLSIVYSILWGLGGSICSSKKRKAFDSALRESVYHQFESDLDIPREYVMYEMVLDLDSAQLKAAGCGDNANAADMPQRFEILQISADMMPAEYSELGNKRLSDRLVFRTPILRALYSAIKVLLGSGGHPLVVGPKGSGKTTIIQEILAELRQNNPSPQVMQQEIVKHLMEIVGEKKEPQGVELVLQTVRSLLRQLRNQVTEPDSRTNFSKSWETIQDGLKSLWSGESSHHCNRKTIFSTTTSLRGTVTADSLRDFLEREFCTEVKNCLETPRYSYGVVFVDDLNICASTLTANEHRMIENRPEALLKGLLSTTPPFGIRKNLRIRMANSGYVGPSDGSMERELTARPVLHRAILTDPRSSIDNQDDFIMQRIGMISAATGDIDDMAKSEPFSHILGHFGVLSLPEMTFTELHVALIVGGYSCLRSGRVGSEIVEKLRSEISDLANFTITVCRKMVSSVDAFLTTDHEKSLRELVGLDINLVSRFCNSLRLGCENIDSPGALLHLYVHEWKRYFLDPIPDGSQHQRFVSLFRDELESIDFKSWCISSEWLASLMDNLSPRTDRVWANPVLFVDKSEYMNKPLASLPTYSPIELDRAAVDLQLRGSLTDASGDEGNKFLRIIDMADCVGDANICAVLSPSGISMISKILRILESGGNHVHLTGYAGTTQHKAVVICSKITEMKLMSFDVKDTMGAVEALPSKQATASFSFKRFLKSVVLRIAGFRNSMGSLDEYEFNTFFQTNSAHYTKVHAERVLVEVSHIQQLDTEERRMLLHLIDYHDPTSLFEEHEIIGLAEALRHAAHQDGSVEHEDDGEILMGRTRSWTGSEEVAPLFQVPTSRNRKQHSTAAESGLGSHFKGKSSLTGYSFQWVKNYLKESIFENMKVVLSSSIPRAMLLKQVHAIDKDIAAGTSAGDDVPEDEIDDIRISGPAVVSERSNMARFSLLSKASFIIPGNKTSSKSPAKDLKSDSSLAVVGFYNCTYLGPMLRRRFQTIWWDVGVEESTQNICTLLFQNDFRRSTTSPPRSSVRLFLKTSSTGEYIEHEALSMQQQGLHNKFLKEEKKVCKLISKQNRSVSVGKFGIEFKNCVQFNISMFLSNFKELGIFQTFRNILVGSAPGIIEYGDLESTETDLKLSEFEVKCRSEHDLAMQESKNELLALMKDESRAILPFLLSTKAPSDAIFLTESAIIFGAERVAEIASEIVLSLLHLVVDHVYSRRYCLQVVREGFLEAQEVLRSIPTKKSVLMRNNEELQLAIRSRSNGLIELKQAVDSAIIDFQALPDSELALMLQEELLTRTLNGEMLQTEANLLMSSASLELHGVSAVEWFALASAYGAKPSDYYLDVMKVLMSVINFILPAPKATKGKKEGSKNKDDLVARSSISLIRSPDFVNQIVMVNPLNLSSEQLFSIAQLDVVEANEPVEDVSIKKSSKQSPSQRPFEVLKNFLVGMKKFHDNIRESKHQKLLASEVQALLRVQVSSNAVALDSRIRALTAQSDVLAEQLQKLDTELEHNKLCLENLQRLSENSIRLVEVLLHRTESVDVELLSLDSVLKVAVADSCVLAAVYARASWLPEEIRQECTDQFRLTLSQMGLKVSQTPFVLGCLSDNLQFRAWTSFSDNSVPRNSQSINTLSLAAVSPYFTYVYDPDGLAESALCMLKPPSYEMCIVSGQRFSLNQLQSWVQIAKETTDAGLFLIITDVQTGASDDLIAFLSAEFCVSQVVGSPGEGVDINDTNTSGQLYELVAHLNPIDDSYSLENSTLHLIKMRVFVVSSKCAVTDPRGWSYPLPACCFKNMTILHWNSSSGESFIVDSKPMDSATGRTHSLDGVLVEKLTRQLCNQISSEHGVQLETTNSNIIKYSRQLDSVLNKMYVTIYSWMVEKRESLAQPFHVDDVLYLPPVTLGFVINRRLCLLVQSTEKERNLVLLDLQCAFSLERELLSYHAVLREVFSMCDDMYRFCSLVIPRNVLPPFALTPRSISTKFLATALKKATELHLYAGTPHSMLGMQRLYRLITASQKKIVRHMAGVCEESVADNHEAVNDSQASQPPSPTKGSKKAAVASHTEPTSRHQGISLKERVRLSPDLHFLLFPLRNFFLKEFVDYLQSIARPGQEWLIKFCLLLTMWSKSSNIPEEELKLLIRFIHGSLGVQLVRYSFYIPTKSAPSEYVMSDISTSRSNSLLDAARFSISKVSRSQSKLTSTSTYSSSKSEEDVESDENYDDFSADLPGIATMKRRVTAFRAILGKATTDDQYARPPMLHRTVSGSMSRFNITEGVSRFFNETLEGKRRRVLDVLRSRGCAGLDGLVVHRQSSRWRIFSGGEYSPLHRGEFIDGSVLSRTDALFLDSDHVDLVPKNPTISLRPRSGDSFEVECLQIEGVKLFSANGIDAAVAFGAPESVVEAISTSISNNRTSVLVTGKNKLGTSTRTAVSSKRLSVITARRKSRQVSVRSTTSDSAPSSRRTSVVSTDKTVAKSSSSNHKYRRVSSKSLADSAQQLESMSSQRNSVISVDGRTSKLNSMIVGLGSHRSTLAVKSTDATPRPSFMAAFSKFEQYDSLSSLLTQPLARKNFHILESHSAMAKIFKGLRNGISEKIEDFQDWKDDIEKFGSHEFVVMNELDLEEAARKFTPPNFIEESEEEMSRGAILDQGLWLKGYELTILQTMLLSESIRPGSTAAIANVLFGLIVTYIEKGGKLVRHVDEVADEGDEDDEGTGTGATGTSCFGIAEEDEYTEESEDTFTGDRIREFYDDVDDDRDGVVQVDVVITNCWSKLRKVIGGRSRARGAIHAEVSPSKYRLCCRDFENWEGVMYDVLHGANDPEKFLYMQSLRQTFHGTHSSLFLCSPSSSNQMAVLSQRVRSMGIHHDSFMPIINCHSQVLTPSFDSRVQRFHLMELQKAIKSAISLSRVHLAIVEMLDICSTAGNAIIGSALTTSGIKFGMSNHMSAKFQHYDGYGESQDSSHVKVLANAQVAVPSKVQAHKTFPLIVTAEWAGPMTGRGPLFALGDLNFTWLPRFFPPDVVGVADHTTQAFTQFSGDLPPGTMESGGILCEELENCLLWVMISCRRLTRATISPLLMKRLRYAKKIQVRATSGLLAIWHLMLYQRSSQRELVGKPGIWSKCLVPLSLWQLARLLMKVSEILDTKWDEPQKKPKGLALPSHHAASDLLSNSRFVKAVYLCAESFASLDGDVMNEKRADESRRRHQHIRQTIQSRNQSLANVSAHKQRQSMFMPTTPSSPMSLGLKPKIPQAPAPAKENMSGMAFAMRRVKKKAAEAAALAIQKRLEGLKSVDRFSFAYKTPKMAALVAKLAGNGKSQDGESVIFRDRFLSFIAIYLSELIIQKREKEFRQGGLALGGGYNLSGDQDSVKKLHRQSMKIDVQNFLSNENTRDCDREASWQPMSRRHCDISLGGLSTDDLISCMVRWTFDGQSEALEGVECEDVPVKRVLDRESREKILRKLRKSLLELAEAKSKP